MTAQGLPSSVGPERLVSKPPSLFLEQPQLLPKKELNVWKQPKCPLMDKRIRKMWHIYMLES